MNEVNKWRVNHVLESNIRNYVRKLIHEAMEAGFSVQDLKNAITTDLQGVKDHSEYKDKITHFLEGGYKYCVKMLGEPIGNGSSRAVFQIDDTRVLKLATNIKGVAQNKAEVAVYNQTADKAFMPIIYNDSDMENYFYVISEYVLPADEEDFEYVLGVSFDTLREIIYDRTMETVIDEYDNLPNFQKLLQYIENMHDDGINIDDWHNINNWGLAKRNGKAIMVTLDNGFTNNVANNFYYKKSSFNGGDLIGGMMGYDESYLQNKRFNKILPMGTFGQDFVYWAYVYGTDDHKNMIEKFYQSNFQDKDIINKLLYDYIKEKFPKFDWGNDNKSIPKYVYEEVTYWIKKFMGFLEKKKLNGEEKNN